MKGQRHPGRVRRFWHVRRFPQCTLVVVALACAGSASAATRYDPRLRFRTLSTAHFDIHFHQREDQQARRLAVIAEDVGATFAASLGRPDSRVHVILVDQTDLSNGWATPVPYNVIEITAAAPPGDSSIGNTDDWLRLVFTHEYTHVVHLSRRRGWIGGLHRVFGRLPIVYPNLFLPTWQIEGIAVFEESARTHAGRIPAADFRQIVSSAGSSGRFEPLDRASGGLIDWPGGTAPYAYGGYFQQYLADRYGEEVLRRLTDETAGRLPYLGTRAYRKVFGRSLGRLWQDFEADVARDVRRDPMAATRLTRHGFNVDALRFGPGGRLFYAAVNPHGFPSLMQVAADGSEPRRITTRFLGNRTAVAGTVLVFDQVELVNSVALQSDLYAVSIEGGPTWRLTRGARAADPDVSPDGGTIVCTQQRADRRDLATLAFSPGARRARTPATLLSEPETDYSAPRWSPDGRSIAAERRRPGMPSEIVLIDVATRQVRAVAAAPGHRSLTPAWTPDGSHVLFASDRDGGPFRVFRVEIASGALDRLDETGSGSVRAPDVAPDGSTLAFIGYTADGFDVFAMNAKTARWTRADGQPHAILNDDRGAPESPTGRQEPSVAPMERSYAAWRTLAPTFWAPTAESDNGEIVLGAATGAADVLGRQGYAVQAGWAASRVRPDWRVAYAYDRWRPTLFVDLSDDTDPFRSGEIRSRELDAGLLWPFRRVRRAQTVLAAFNAATDTLRCGFCTPAVNVQAVRRSVRGGWSFDSAKSYGYSIGAEEGVRLLAAVDATRRAVGADGDATSTTLDLRVYRAVFPRHAVVAARLGAAASWGDQRVRRVFNAAGAGPRPFGFDFGADAVALLRGFGEDAVIGANVVTANLDYRVPLLRVERGAGTVPVFLRTIHAAAFVDSGHAWTGSVHAGDFRLSAGAELSVDTVIGYVLPITLTGGAAWRRDPTGRDPGWTVFGRIGRAF